MKSDKSYFTVLKNVPAYSDCPACDGTGIRKTEHRNRVYSSMCGKCKGSGKIETIVKIEVPLIAALDEIKKNGTSLPLEFV